jgi:hypothetical protein
MQNAAEQEIATAAEKPFITGIAAPTHNNASG